MITIFTQIYFCVVKVFFILLLSFLSASAQQNETPSETPSESPGLNQPPLLSIDKLSTFVSIKPGEEKEFIYTVTAIDRELDRMHSELISSLPGEIHVIKDEPGELIFEYKILLRPELAGEHTLTFIVRDEGSPALHMSLTRTLKLRLKINNPPDITFIPLQGMKRFYNRNIDDFTYQTDAGSSIALELRLTEPNLDTLFYEITSSLEHTLLNKREFGGEQIHRVYLDMQFNTEIKDIGNHTITVSTSDDGDPPASQTAVLHFSIHPYREEPVFGRGINGLPEFFVSAYQHLDDIYTFPFPVSSVPNKHVPFNGGGLNRITYLSSGNVFRENRNPYYKQLVVSYGPITASATYPNIINVVEFAGDSPYIRRVKHTFSPFPTGDRTIANYNGGELRTTVGNFLGSDVSQIAVAQGYGGQQVVRMFEITDQPRPRGWQVVKQFFGLTGNAADENLNKGQTLASGDLDGDSLDELVVGQTNSSTSQTRFQVIDADNSPPGTILSRFEFTAFPPDQRGNGGIETVIADLNGDGQQELIITSQGNSRDHGDERDSAQLNLITILQPVVQNQRVVDFTRAIGGTFLYSLKNRTLPVL